MRSMVLAPIEPVAPSTVTLRSAARTAGLDRRSGLPFFITSLHRTSPHRQPTLSPHHEPARWRFEPAAGEPDECRDGGRRYKAVEAIHQSPMAGDQMAGILGPEAAFERGFEQVASLCDDRQHDRNRAERKTRGERKWLGKDHRHRDRRHYPTDRSRPGFFRADLRREFWAADRASDEIGDNVARPDHSKQEDRGGETLVRVRPQQNRRDGDETGIR